MGLLPTLGSDEDPTADNPYQSSGPAGLAEH